MGTSFILPLSLLLLHSSLTCARPDFLDTMSSQFFGSHKNDGQSNHQQQSNRNNLSQLFGSASQQVPQKFPARAYPRPHSQQSHPPRRQGNFALSQQAQHQHSHQVQYQYPQQVQYQDPQQVQYQQLQQVQYQQPNQVQHHQQPPLPVYNGPPPVYGQQQGYAQLQPDTNETKTDGYPPDNQNHLENHIQHHNQEIQHYSPIEYHQPEQVAVPYHKPPTTVVEYQPQHHAHVPQQYEYQHIPPPTVEVSENFKPLLQIHTGKENAYHEPPAHVEFQHPPQVKHHHYTTHKPRRFHFSLNEPSPKYRIIDQHLKIPPVKFRFHFNPKVVIISDTKDPLEKKHQDDEHDLEPFPPPDAFGDPNAPPSINTQIVEHYPVKDHYPVVGHHAAKHVAEYPQAEHPYPVEHHSVDHHPVHEYTYDLSQGHSHQNPHRSLGHYEPTFRVKTKPIVYTEPPPTRPTTTTTTARPTTSTSRTTTTRSTTTPRPTRRAQINARNPGYSVAFTEGSTTTTTEAFPTSSTTTRQSISRSNSERERENGGISERKDELSTTSESSSSIQTTNTTPESDISITISTPSTTPKLDTITTTLITEKPISVTTTISNSAITTATETPTTPSTTTSTTTTPTQNQPTPAEETTPHTTTLSVDTNEIDIQKDTGPPRRRPEPLLDEFSNMERSESFNFENSESVKVIETTILIDGKNQTVKFYYITEPVKVPQSVFQKMAKQRTASGFNVMKIRNKRFVQDDFESD